MSWRTGIGEIAIFISNECCREHTTPELYNLTLSNCLFSFALLPGSAAYAADLDHRSHQFIIHH